MYSDAFSNDIELALLSTLLNNGELAFDIEGKLPHYMFGSLIYAEIYKSIVAIVQRNSVPDFLLVRGDLLDKNKLDYIGGVDTLETIVKTSYNTGALLEYINKIHQSYKIRSLMSLNAQLPKVLEHTEPDIVISELTKKLDNLVAEGGYEDTVLLVDATDRALKNTEARMENPGISGLRTGFPSVDRLTGGLSGGTLWYIGGRPGHGKSAFLAKLLLNLAKDGVGSLLINKEMTVDATTERMLSIVSSVPAMNIRLGTLSKTEFSVLVNTRNIIANYPIYIDNNFSSDINFICSTIRRYKQLHDIKVVGIDYIQLLAERNEGQVHELGRISRALKLLAVELDICIVVLSQVNRNCEEREDKRPMSADLRQSGNLEEDGDFMIAVYRDAMYYEHTPDRDNLEFIIRKARGGPTGTIILKFNQETVNVFETLDSWS